eukprot:2149372-Pyramimonas_sp.AAC.1
MAAQGRCQGDDPFPPEAERSDKQGPQATSDGAACFVRDGLQADESAPSLPSASRYRSSRVEVTGFSADI